MMIRYHGNSLGVQVMYTWIGERLSHLHTRLHTWSWSSTMVNGRTKVASTCNQAIKEEIIFRIRVWLS